MIRIAQNSHCDLRSRLLRARRGAAALMVCAGLAAALPAGIARADEKGKSERRDREPGKAREVVKDSKGGDANAAIEAQIAQYEQVFNDAGIKLGDLGVNRSGQPREYLEVLQRQAGAMGLGLAGAKGMPQPPTVARPGQPAMLSIPNSPQGAGRSVQGQQPGAAQMQPVAPMPVSPHIDPVLGDEFTFNFTEPIEVIVLVDFVRQALDMQVLFLDGGLQGQKVFFNSAITVKRRNVLPFLMGILEQKEYTMVQDPAGPFIVMPKNQIAAGLVGGEFSTTRILRTPNIKPTSLQNPIAMLLQASRAPGQPGAQPVFMDELGLIVITDTPRLTALVEDLINRLVEERSQIKFRRYPLEHISAVSARDRVLELLGTQAQRVSAAAAPGQPGQPPVGIPGGGMGSITNLAERLTIDPTSNALWFRGRGDEQDFLQELLGVADVPNSMVSKWYPVGLATAEAVASQGRAEQLGGVSVFESSAGGTGGGVASRGGGAVGIPGAGGGAGGGSEITGSGFVLYPEAGGFIYRGTESQHQRIEKLVADMRDISRSDEPVYEFYKLRHGKSTDVADIIQNLISNSAPSGNRAGGLLNRDLGARSAQSARRTTPQPPRGVTNPNAPASPAAAAADPNSVAAIDSADVFVLADEPNNQVLVKAPRKLQPQFKNLISRIDLRRPQVYIDAKIVAISDSDDFRLAVEAQQIIGQFAFNTNFGLGSLTTGSGTSTTGGITSRKNVATNLGGLTSALIRSKDVPFIVNALARNNESRIIATPQLLVDDNEEAEISSLEKQPTATTTLGGTGQQNISGFAGFEEAGPKLKIKPQISEGGYLRLEYELELSSFTGSASGNLPPPKQENKISSKSVTVPTDATIVVGGLTFETTGKTVVKVPLLGDIPIVGHLFKDESTSKRNTTLYIFITPKIMRDPSFADLRLLTRGPLAEVKIPGEYPDPKPERIDILDGAKYQTEQEAKLDIDKNTRPESISPAKGTPKPPREWPTEPN